MIGRQPLPTEYVDWNERWGAPFGHPVSMRASLRERIAQPEQRYGPFAFQVNSGTRVFEYPWAYFTIGATPGMRILEAGGGMSGLQFVLAMEGCEVVNVDPYIDTDTGHATAMFAWQLSSDLHSRVNSLFGTDVKLIQKRLQDADLTPASFDRIVCLSVIEHLDPAEARDLVEHIATLLAPGGLFVASVDLFLDLEPFGVLRRNSYGSNIDICRLIEDVGLELIHGDTRELFGMAAFDRDRIVDALPELFLSPGYPCVSQTLILRKPD